MGAVREVRNRPTAAIQGSLLVHEIKGQVLASSRNSLVQILYKAYPFSKLIDPTFKIYRKA